MERPTDNMMVGGEALAGVLEKTKVAIEDAALYPVDIETLTPESTFRKNAVIGINGVLYRAKKATDTLPVTLQIVDGKYLIDEVDGKRSFVITDDALSEDWEVWTDSALDYWLQSLTQQISNISEQNARMGGRIDKTEAKANTAVQPDATYTYEGHTYTVSQLLQAMTKLMETTVVINA